MIFLILIIGVLLFAGSAIFMKKKILQWLGIIVGVLLIGISEAGIILNDCNYFGMTKVATVHQEELKSTANPPQINVESKDSLFIYQFQTADGKMKTINTDQMKITIKRGGEMPVLKMTETKVVFDNSFYEGLFFLQHKNDEVIQQKATFLLPDNWEIKQ